MTKQRYFTFFTIAILALFTIFPSVALAQEEAPDSYNDRLESQFLRLQEVSANGDEKLAHAHEVVAAVDEWIVKLQEQGVDTAELEDALADLEIALVSSEALKAEGDAILDEHAGFDDDGNVIDPQVAGDTLEAVKAKFREAKQTLHEAGRNLKHTVKRFRRDHRPDHLNEQG